MKMKRKILCLTLFSLLFFSCQDEKEVYLFTSFREPATDGLTLLYSYDGISWRRIDTVLLKPKIGNQKVMRDPSLIQGPDGIFHLVWTSSWKGDLGFGYTSSKDLINWSEQKLIPVMAWDSTTVNVWAPELFYDDVKMEYIIIWASTIPFRFEKGIEDEYNNHRLYYTTTKDFNTFSGSKLFFNPGYSVIDGVIIKRDKNDYVLVFKDNTRPNRNLRVAFSTSPLGPFSGISEPFTDNFTEGPAWLKKDNTWIIYYDVYRENKYGAVKTSDFKTFNDISDSIKVPGGHKHGTIIKIKKKFWRKIIKNSKFIKYETGG
jgi:hypothetical protein